VSIHELHDRCRQLETALAQPRAEETTGNSAEEPAVRVAPKGLGDLTMDLIESEVGDWTRFRNRGQVASFTGLCSSERSTAGSRRQGAIDRQGNARIRTQLVEAVWRLRQWNQGWRAFRKFPHVFGEKTTCGPAARKKAVVACARMLMIDLWRLNTGQTTLDRLGLTA
jgi:transposase